MTLLLADTSAWIAYQRREVTPTSVALRNAIAQRSVATVDIVALELLAGIDPQRVEEWTALLSSTEHVRQLPWVDVEAAAELYRTCRQQGFTPRSLVDCLIAAIALRVEMPVLHDDRDYDAIARCCGLQVIRA